MEPWWRNPGLTIGPAAPSSDAKAQQSLQPLPEVWGLHSPDPHREATPSSPSTHLQAAGRGRLGGRAFILLGCLHRAGCSLANELLLAGTPLGTPSLSAARAGKGGGSLRVWSSRLFALLMTSNDLPLCLSANTERGRYILLICLGGS